MEAYNLSKLKRSFRLIVIGALVAFLLVACDASKVKLNDKITTPGGDVLIERAEISGRFPKDCQEADCIQNVEAGQQIIVVWASFPDQDFLRMDTIVSLGKSYLITGDGLQIDLTEHGVLPEGYYLLFKVPDDAKNFTLHIEDKSIKLGNLHQ